MRLRPSESQRLTGPSTPRGLSRTYKAIAIVLMPQASSAYTFLALSFAIGFANSIPYFLVSLIFASLLQISSLLAYVRFFRKNANVEDREDRPVLFAIAIFSYLVGFALLRYLEAPFIFSTLMLAYVSDTIVAAVITNTSQK